MDPTSTYAMRILRQRSKDRQQGFITLTSSLMRDRATMEQLVDAVLSVRMAIVSDQSPQGMLLDALMSDVSRQLLEELYPPQVVPHCTAHGHPHDETHECSSHSHPISKELA